MPFVPLNTNNSDLANHNNVNNALRDLNNQIRIIEKTVTPLITPDTTWNTFSYQNGWEDYDTVYVAGYRKDALGFVHLKGLIKSGTTTDTTVMLNLPAGYRPGTQQLFPVAVNNALVTAQTGNVRVLVNGDIQARSNISATWTSLSGIVFLAEQ